MNNRARIKPNILKDLKKKYAEYPHLDNSEIVNMELSKSLNSDSENSLAMGR